MGHSRTWPCQLELVVHRAGSGAPWLASQPVVAAAAIVLSSWV